MSVNRNVTVPDGSSRIAVSRRSRPRRATRRRRPRHRRRRRPPRSRRRRRPSPRTRAARARSRTPTRDRRSRARWRRSRDRRWARSSRSSSSCELFGHRDVRRLEHALGDPEGDPVDEVALPQLERRGRRLLQAREVGQVAAERLPALGLEFAGLRAAAPQPPLGERADHQHGVHRPPRPRAPSRTTSLQRGYDRAPAVDRDANSDDADRDEGDQRARRAGRRRRAEPLAAARSRSPPRLERREARSSPSRSAAICSRNRDSRSEPPSSTSSTTSATAAPSPQRRRVPGGELEIGDRLRAEASPRRRPLGRDRLRGVDAAPDQVEQRRRELERAGLPALAQQRRHERGPRVRRRLLLVLAVVAGPQLATEEPEDRADHEHRRHEAEHEQEEEVAPRVLLRVLDPLVVVRVRGRVGLLLAPRSSRGPCRGRPSSRRSRRTPSAGSAPAARRTGGRGCRPRAASRASRESHVAAHPGGMTPGAQYLARRGQRRGQLLEAHLPLVAPDLEVDVDHVVVGDRDPAQRVAHLERAHLVGAA